MKRSILERNRLTFIALIVLSQAACSEAQEEKKSKEERIKAAAVKNWKELFGSNIQFAEKGLYGCMSYVHPQPDQLMIDMDDKKVIGTSVDSTMKLFFKPAYRFNVKKHPPEKYYLRKNDEEPSLLYYEWRTPKYSFRMYESGNGILIRIKPKGHDPSKPITDKALSAALYDVIDMKSLSAVKTAEAFKLPRTLSAGAVFTNAKKVNVAEVGEWKNHVIGFLSNEDICVICFFAEDRMKVGFDFKPKWLDGRIFEKDGKTPVNPRGKDK